MDEHLLNREELIEKGYDYDDLEMVPSSDQLFVRTGEEGDDLVPVNGLVYELSEGDGSLLYYGEFENGLPHGISVDFHPGGGAKEIHAHFHGPIHGERNRWNKEGCLVLWGEYAHGHELRLKIWDDSGQLVEEKKEPDDSQLGIIEKSREFYRRHYGGD
ncbi:toxin-antitoxin system YwqK family antitoxin [Edaphobacillus lindanitolerans]|uniref:MORN repeat variant n=1 Tax=Edaphobacillus lindanitolerans TaxID=550447 RepID=A0A1U7PNK7_9BACI|nr:hypothetical protein [Edaphobacillus lindanitolerans]SIT73049.1 hypothetical protein SAMN05428946_0933 [Edaphobacillus lindanitolerans]